MKRLLTAAAALLALYCVPAARAQDPNYTYPAVDVTDPLNYPFFNVIFQQDVALPYLGTDFVQAAFTPFAAPDPVPDGVMGPTGLGKGAFFGSGGTSVVTIDSPPGSHAAHIRVNLAPNGLVGPLVGVLGMMSIHIIPLDPFHPQPPRRVWFPVGYSATSGVLPGFVWDCTVSVPPSSMVYAIFIGNAFGTYGMGTVPGVGASLWVF